MSLSVVAWNDYDDDFAAYPDRLRVASLEVTTMAEECAAGSSTVVLDDSTADFYIYGFRPIYFIESAAADDPYLGIIGPFWTETRKWTRGNERTGSRRQIDIALRDINSLLNLRVQKGTDASREAETDVARVDWLINTAEVIGGYGDHGLSIDVTDYFFTDAPVNMSESDYTGQYSAGVLDDCMQQSGANCYLYPAPTEADPMRMGIWYGRTERSDFASLHKISNDPADISPEYYSGWQGVTPQYDTGYVFPPSLDMTLDRDPSRQITGVMVQYDGDYIYDSLADPPDTLTRRDMVFAGELVKNATQAAARAARYLADLDEEDDAITCAVQVPDWLVHAFVAGNRVQVKATHLATLGYDEYVWMRVTSVTTRQLQGEDGNALGLYELALDLRAETPPGPAAPPPPPDPVPVPCGDGTPGIAAHDQFAVGKHVPPNGNAGPTPSPGLVQYFRAGIGPIFEPDTTHTNSWQFPVFGTGGVGTQDYAGANLGNSIRFIIASAGTMTPDAFFSHSTSGSWRLFHLEGFIEVDDDSGSIATNGSVPPVTVTQEMIEEHCYHIYTIYNWTSGGSGRFTYEGYSWEPEMTS